MIGAGEEEMGEGKGGGERRRGKEEGKGGGEREGRLEGRENSGG